MKQDLAPSIRAENGAQFFDDSCPDWHERINVDALDIHDPERCILGQLCGTYGKGQFTFRLNDSQSTDFGLYTHRGNTNAKEEYGHLTACWKKEVRRRQAGVARTCAPNVLKSPPKDRAAKALAACALGIAFIASRILLS